MLKRVPVSDKAKSDLLTLIGSADRHYHNIAHVAALWRRHLALCPGTGMDGADIQVRLSAAILWHDAIYNAGRGDNELRSAALWRAAAQSGTIPLPAVDWVATAIAATADHIGARSPLGFADRALQWVLDLDLTPLGEEPYEFARNTARLALENALAPGGFWKERRAMFLRRVAACPRIYLSPAIAASFEAQARANIARELSSACCG